jgi:hypothetical protein
VDSQLYLSITFLNKVCFSTLKSRGMLNFQTNGKLQSKVLPTGLLCFCLLFILELNATAYFTKATGNWNARSTWSTVSCGKLTNTGNFPVAGDVVTICNPHKVTITTNTACFAITILDGGVLTAFNYFTLTVTNHMDVQLGGSVNLDGKGNEGGNGSSPGVYINTCRTPTLGSGGGGYGGFGGDGGRSSGGTTIYGSFTAPLSLGSGGGNTFCTIGNDGGSGGGALKIVVTHKLTVNGSIRANGMAGGNYTGGGSGGSLWLISELFSGATGTISANGGEGYYDPPFYGGGGGGGRIALYYTSNNYSGAISATGGDAQGSAQNGGTGTIYEKPAQLEGRLRVGYSGKPKVLMSLDSR